MRCPYGNSRVPTQQIPQTVRNNNIKIRYRHGGIVLDGGGNGLIGTDNPIFSNQVVPKIDNGECKQQKYG